MSSWPPSDADLLDEYAKTKGVRRDHFCKKYGISRSTFERQISEASARLGVSLGGKRGAVSRLWPPSDEYLIEFSERNTASWVALSEEFGVSQEVARSAISIARKRHGVVKRPCYEKRERPGNKELLDMVAAHGKQKAADMLGISRATIAVWVINAEEAVNPNKKKRIPDDRWVILIRKYEKLIPTHVPREANC